MDPHPPKVPNHNPFSGEDGSQQEQGCKLISLHAPGCLDVETELEQIRQQIVGDLNRLRQTELHYSQYPPGITDQVPSAADAGGHRASEIDARAASAHHDQNLDGLFPPENPFLCIQAGNSFSVAGQQRVATTAPGEPSDAAQDAFDSELGDGFWTAAPSTEPVVDADAFVANKQQAFLSPGHDPRAK